MVAAMSVTQRFSTAGSSASCWVLENRCTSSTNSTVSAPVQAQVSPGLVDHRADVLDPGGHRRQLDETAARWPGRRRGRAWSCRCPAAPRAAPTSADVATLDQPAQRRARRQQVVLPDDLVERPRAHPDGQRHVPARPASLRLRSAAGATATADHTAEQVVRLTSRDPQLDPPISRAWPPATASMPASLRCSGGDRRGRAGQRVVAAAGLREGDHVADRLGAGQQQRRSGPSRRRCRRAAAAPNAKASSRKPNFSCASSSAEAHHREDPLLDVAAVDTDRAAADLVAVADDVVRVGQRRSGVGRRSVSIHSGFGEVNAWCTAVHAPEPTATSPSVASPARTAGRRPPSRNDQADSSISPQPAADLEPGRTEQGPRLRTRRPAAKKTQSPGSAPTARGQPVPLGVGEVLGHRAARARRPRRRARRPALARRAAWPTPARRPAAGAAGRRRRA